MSGGKTLIGSTAYSINGGKTCIGGTAYSINGGETLIGGTGYTISFTPEMTLKALFKNAVITHIAGRNSGTGGTIDISLTSFGTFYAFCFNSYYFRITKLIGSGNVVSVMGSINNTSSANNNVIVTNNTLCSMARNATDTSPTSYKNATMALLQFRGYKDAQVDNLLSSATLLPVGGGDFNSSGAPRAVGKTSLKSEGRISLTAFDNYFGVGVSDSNGGIVENLSGNNPPNLSLLMDYNTSQLAMSLDGVNPVSLYGYGCVAIY